MNFDFATYLQFALALVFVLALIGVFAILARRFGFGTGAPLKRGQRRRLAVVEALALDGKRRLLLVRRDATEHLVILGPTSETVVERGITAGGDFAAAARAEGARLAAGGERSPATVTSRSEKPR